MIIMKKRNYSFIHKWQTQGMACVLMLVVSIGPIAASYLYIPVVVASQPEETVTESESETPASTMIAVDQTTAGTPEEEEFVPSSGELNLAHYFPEGADQSKVEESLAGDAFKVLMNRDAEWLNSIYDYADLTPARAASRLGHSTSSVMGKYNPNDTRHNPDDSSTWTINSFKKIRMTITNGDGQAVNAYSNVIDIMSMANLYTYYHDIEDYEQFLSYSEKLWKSSHSYSVRMSDVYHCEGCLGEGADQREREELEAEAKAEMLNLLGQLTEDMNASKLPSSTNSAAENNETSSVIVAGTSKTEETSEEASVETSETAVQETEPPSSSAVITIGGGGAGEASEQEYETSTAIAPEAAMGAVFGVAFGDGGRFETETAGETDQSAGDATPSNIASETQPTSANNSIGKSKNTTLYQCPGHVDLIVNAKILGVKENKGLFSVDSIGNDKANITEGGWQGWNDEAKESVKEHSSQDWYAKYGLSVSSFSMRNPLSEAEIEEYMKQLPKDLSQTRKDMIRFALSSVGKVPYYWGGKPSAANYGSNNFGILTTPDYKGRVLKGLDCSGWINWVYWSSTGQRLDYESTSGLALCGTKISRDKLQPGDIIIRTGTDAHVIMFLGWTEDGRIRCIHESSGSTNNVTVSIRDANWPYYRKLVD